MRPPAIVASALTHLCTATTSVHTSILQMRILELLLLSSDIDITPFPACATGAIEWLMKSCNMSCGTKNVVGGRGGDKKFFFWFSCHHALRNRASYTKKPSGMACAVMRYVYGLEANEVTGSIGPRVHNFRCFGALNHTVRHVALGIDISGWSPSRAYFYFIRSSRRTCSVALCVGVDHASLPNAYPCIFSR